MTRRPRRDPVIVEIKPLFVYELQRDLAGKGVQMPRCPDRAAGESLRPVAVEVCPPVDSPRATRRSRRR
jgi:hypothetical protein